MLVFVLVFLLSVVISDMEWVGEPLISSSNTSDGKTNGNSIPIGELVGIIVAGSCCAFFLACLFVFCYCHLVGGFVLTLYILEQSVFGKVEDIDNYENLDDNVEE